MWQVGHWSEAHKHQPAAHLRRPYPCVRTRSHRTYPPRLPGLTHLSCPAPLRSLMPRGLPRAAPLPPACSIPPSTTSQHAAHALRRALPLPGPALATGPG